MNNVISCFHKFFRTIFQNLRQNIDYFRTILIINSGKTDTNLLVCLSVFMMRLIERDINFDIYYNLFFLTNKIKIKSF